VRFRENVEAVLHNFKDLIQIEEVENYKLFKSDFTIDDE